MQKSKSHIAISKKLSVGKEIPLKIANIGGLPKSTEKSQSKEVGKDIQKESSPQRHTSSSHKKGYMKELSVLKGDDFGRQIENKEEELNAKKEKLCCCINLFNLMQSSNSQLRCVQHNNTLTLYCLTQRKVLCVNCNYGDYKHKTHKIIPLKDSGKYISEDNQLLKEILNKDLKSIQESIRNCQENSVLLERQLKTSLDELQKEFLKKIEGLKKTYESETDKITKNYSKFILKSRSLEKDIEQFKLKIWQTISKIGIGKRSDTPSGELQITRQVLCSSLAELTQFQIKKVGKKQLERITHKSKFT